MKTDHHDALVIVDYQNDFIDGTLPVPGAAGLLETINEAIEAFLACFNPIAFTRCWHPEKHCSFLGYGGTWPVHCVQNTHGAAYPKGLVIPPSADHFSKGRNVNIEEYSAFPALGEWLRERGAKRVFICGVATDYCVHQTVMDARREGFNTLVMWNGIAGVKEDTSARRRAEMMLAGAEFI